MGYSSSSKAYPMYKMCIEIDVHVIFDESRRIEKNLQNKEDSKIDEMFQIQGHDPNNELAEEHPRHDSNNLKETDADDEPNGGSSFVESVEQR